jgi:hypothetical protein
MQKGQPPLIPSFTKEGDSRLRGNDETQSNSRPWLVGELWPMAKCYAVEISKASRFAAQEKPPLDPLHNQEGHRKNDNHAEIPLNEEGEFESGDHGAGHRVMGRLACCRRAGIQVDSVLF